MARFPVIQRSCPLSASERAKLTGNCHVCMKAVHDLGAMSDAERATYMAAQSGPVCVSYRLRAPARTAAVGVAAALIAMGAPHAAATGSIEGFPPVVEQGAGLIPQPPEVQEVCADEVDESESLDELEYILVGGVEAGEAVHWFDADALPGLTSITAVEGDELIDWNSTRDAKRD